MNRNTEAHFSQLPTLEISRSKFNMGHTHTTTVNAAELVPIYVDPDIVPGDTVTMKMSDVIRMMTPIAPVMGNAFADFYFFFVPNRLVWQNWKQCMGENETAPWTQLTEKTVPQIKIKNDQKHGTTNKLTRTILKGSLLNHMGIPLQESWEYDAAGNKEISISSLPVKSYCLIWNEFFRDENLQNPVNINKTDANLTVINTNSATYIGDPDATTISYEQNGGLPCLKVCKPHDYFTSCLPGAQKGPHVTIPLEGEVPIRIMQRHYDAEADPTTTWEDLGIFEMDSDLISSGADAKTFVEYNDYYKPSANVSGTPVEGSFQFYSDMEHAVGASINQLRQAFAIQKFYERDARGGTRYIESIWAHFRVRNPDYRMQRPEYLGGFRQNINMNQVVQNSPTVESSTPLGTTGAYSVSSNQQNDLFSHSFTEHGCLIGLMCIRTEHTYCQGINRAWFKKKRLDFYTPEFANLGEMAVLNKEIYAQGTTEDEEAFGYQEAWAEMRYKPNICSGEMDLTLSDTLGGVWTYTDKYEAKPTLGDKWIQETDTNIQRTLAIQNHDQFMCDFYFEPIYTRPLPLYSVPGLIDHH